MDISGEYMLTNVREMASGFLLMPDHQFQFFFSYGALDRQAKGEWRQEGDQVIFNSTSWSGADFSIINSSAEQPEEGIVVVLDPPNPMLAAYLHLSLSGGQADSWVQFRGPGELRLEPQEFDSLAIQFEFCPERFTVLLITKGHNQFVIRPEPTLFELYLDQFTLLHTVDGLSGKHPLLEGVFEYHRTGSGKP
jgi:hypothetical protein